MPLRPARSDVPGRGRLVSMTPPVPEIDVSQIPSEPELQPYILDVREDHEWAAGHIEGARHIRLMDVPAKLLDIPTDQPVFVVCRIGTRSSRAAPFLTGQGVNAINVAGGFKAWQSSGRQIVGPVNQQPA